MYIYHPSLFTNLEVDFSKEILQPPLRSKPLPPRAPAILFLAPDLETARDVSQNRSLAVACCVQNPKLIEIVIPSSWSKRGLPCWIMVCNPLANR